MRHRISLYLSLVGLAALAAIWGCGGGQQTSRPDAPEVGRLNTALPAPSAMRKTLSGTGDVVVAGADFNPAWPNARVAANGAQGVFTPQAGDPPVMADMAFAVYHLNLAGIQSGDDMDVINLVWSTTPSPADGMNVWVAVSEWEADRWAWYYTLDSGQVLSVWDLYEDATDTAGNLLLVVALAGSTELTLDNIAVHQPVEPGRGDWWMLGHDPQHTCCSPFAGPDTAALKWTYDTGAAINHAPVIYADDSVIVSTPGALNIVYPNGDYKDKYYIYGAVYSCTPAISEDGKIYVSDGQSFVLQAINAEGDSDWTFLPEVGTQASPLIGPNGKIYIASDTPAMHAVDSYSGAANWDYTLADPPSSSPALSHDGMIYIAASPFLEQAGRLYAIDSAGAYQWQFAFPMNVNSSPAVAGDGTVYIGCSDHKLYAIKPDGSLKWSFETGSLITSSPAIGSDGTIYIGSQDHKLYALDPAGTELWSFDTGSYLSHPLAVDANGTVYAANGTHQLFAIKHDGTQAWVYEGASNFAAPALGEDGTLYIGDSDGMLYAFGADSGAH